MSISTRFAKSFGAALVAALVLLTSGAAQAQNLSISDVSQSEGNAGTTTFTFTVSLDAPAGLGGVTFDIATADGTATDANSDYTLKSLTGQTIPQGSDQYVFDVLVTADTTPEPNENFFVNVTNVTGATVTDGQGEGTIVNDDLTAIHDIQGPGASSPIVGAIVTTRGIVTGVRPDGFFIQDDDANVDADPATSEGIFVFTSSAPPVAAAFTARVEVTGTVAEFVPTSDPLQPSVTRLTGPSVTQLAAPGQTLPTAVTLTSTFPDPAGPYDQLERVEGMRVTVASLTVTGPTGGNVNEANATGTSNGLFHGVITGVARPFREAGIQAPDLPPTGSIPPIPRWDANPERIGVDSDGINSQPIIDVKSGDDVASITGPLDYALRTYTILPDGTIGTPNVTPGTLTSTVTSAAGNEVTVASVNLRRLFDTVDDPAHPEPVLTLPAFDNRLARASLAIRTHLLGPDIIGVQEVENLATLNALAAKIVADGGPSYTAYVEEGNDPEGLDVGFLVKTDLVTGGVPRVSVTSVSQTLAGSTWINPVDNQPAILHERPPLVLRATVNRTSTVSFDIVVVVTDQLGLTGIDDLTANGLTTTGDYVRRKRQAQAASLANYVQLRQTNDAAEHLAVIGSFNAFEVNDGYADVMGTVAGAPAADNETVTPGDGVDLVNPDLVNLSSTTPQSERYSDVFLGDARNIDHVLVSGGMMNATLGRRIERPRIAADYSEQEMNSGASALRFSDRDPVVAYFSAISLGITDVGVTNVDTPDPVMAGQNVTYTITVTNSGSDPAAAVTLSNPLPAGTTFVSLAEPCGWSCTTPAVGANGTISCTNFLLGTGSDVFTLEVATSPSLSSGTTLASSVTVGSATSDSAPGNESATATTTVDGTPTITDISNQTIDEDATTGALPFMIDDVGTPASSLVLAVSSSDQTLVPNANIVLGGSGTNRTITVTPVANGNGGPVIITVTVTDGMPSQSSDMFALMVTPVNDAPTIGTIANQSGDANATIGPLAFTVGDIDNPVADLTLSATSSNQALVANGGITFGGSGANRTITVTPLANQGGQTTITVTVNDGATTATTSFVLTVTPPSEPTALTYYLAEGATGSFFDEDLMIANPNTTVAHVTVTFFVEGAANITQTRTIPAKSGITLHVDTLPGLEATAAAVQVRSDDGLPLAVERTQFWGDGLYGGHTENAVSAPAPRWYFAEGSQGWFDTFLLIGNPQADPIDVTLTFLRESDTPFTTTVQLGPMSRKTISAATIPELVNRSFGIIVDATQPVVAERAMYFGSTATRPWSGGGDAAGATAPSVDWYFAEGATGTFFDTFILMMNPDTTNDAHVTLRYLLDTGESIDVPKVVPANGRLTVNIEAEDDVRLHAASMSARITSDRPIVAERSVYWPTAEGAQPWGESHVTQGVTAAGSRWALAEGRTGGALNFHTYVLLGNPSSQTAEVTVEFLPQTGTPVVKTFTVPAGSRFTVDATADAPTIQNTSFITLISTAGGVPIVVERSLYWDGAGLTWSGGSSAVATRLPEPPE